jgi:hypothetical protein
LRTRLSQVLITSSLFLADDSASTSLAPCNRSAQTATHQRTPLAARPTPHDSASTGLQSMAPCNKGPLKQHAERMGCTGAAPSLQRPSTSSRLQRARAHKLRARGQSGGLGERASSLDAWAHAKRGTQAPGAAPAPLPASCAHGPCLSQPNRHMDCSTGARWAPAAPPPPRQPSQPGPAPRCARPSSM